MDNEPRTLIEFDLYRDGFIYDDESDGSGRVWATPSDLGSLTVNLDRDGSGLGYTVGTGSNDDGWSTTMAVPEPGTMVLFAIGMLTVAARRRRK